MNQRPTFDWPLQNFCQISRYLSRSFSQFVEFPEKGVSVLEVKMLLSTSEPTEDAIFGGLTCALPIRNQICCSSSSLKQQLHDPPSVHESQSS